ncbi:hypothetical protein LOTGIDRAFT_175156 [Lottia gigantea]|uniref:Uncharacterized protein n=1 Tax=Lottia gigantea TaxID=225164 RepID=V4APJ1_LOTGI|nr:hypothetical protein LOTGIDRAFT_175156 [Lottia gigantea]ESO95551.1 hypothetical protein LOTGIDRAFT_175156 [Lottia gigantea]
MQACAAFPQCQATFVKFASASPFYKHLGNGFLDYLYLMVSGLMRADAFYQETYSEAIKILKGEYTIKAIDEHKMDKALLFCRTKIDCDNLENYLKQTGGLDLNYQQLPTTTNNYLVCDISVRWKRTLTCHLPTNHQ